VPVVFSEEGDVAVIGVTALEIFGLEVDMVRGGAQGGRVTPPRTHQCIKAVEDHSNDPSTLSCWRAVKEVL
jgi:hypothetical protein